MSMHQNFKFWETKKRPLHLVPQRGEAAFGEGGAEGKLGGGRRRGCGVVLSNKERRKELFREKDAFAH